MPLTSCCLIRSSGSNQRFVAFACGSRRYSEPGQELEHLLHRLDEQVDAAWPSEFLEMGRLRSHRGDGVTAVCRRCQRPGQPLDSPASLAWEPIIEEGKVIGMICPDCLTVRERRRIRAEQNRIIRGLKSGLPAG
jgi:hypothetical protein